MKKYISEFIGTAVLVLFGCGTAVMTGNILITAIAFGLSIVAMAYAIGNVSGCHINPAVSLAMLITGKLSFKDFIFYVIAQIAGAFAGIGLLCAIFNNTIIGDTSLGANGFGDFSAAGIEAGAAFLVEVILTFVFVYVILGVTSDEKKSSVSGIVIGSTLAFVHILGIPLTGTSVNPARSLAPAVVQSITGAEVAKAQGYEGSPIGQIWVFILAPLVGAALAAIVFTLLNKKKAEKKVEEKEVVKVEPAKKPIATTTTKKPVAKKKAPAKKTTKK